jgi:hypothetical protein
MCIIKHNLQLLPIDGKFVSLEAGIILTAVNSLPLPAHIHYELLLQLLEKRSVPAMQEMCLDPQVAAKLKASREYLHSTLIMLRKAVALQKQLEEICALQGIDVTYRWFLNELED